MIKTTAYGSLHAWQDLCARLCRPQPTGSGDSLLEHEIHPSAEVAVIWSARADDVVRMAERVTASNGGTLFGDWEDEDTGEKGSFSVENGALIG